MVIFIVVATIIFITLSIINKSNREKRSGRLMQISIKCNLHEKDYGYEYIYYENTGDIKEAGGDGYLINITGANKYSDAYVALDIINEYALNNGGNCSVSDAVPYKE